MEVLELVTRAQQGDAEAFHTLEQRYRNKIRFLAERFLANRPEADAVTNAVFVSAREKLPRLKDASLFYGWLEWAAARECREKLRNRVPAVFRERKTGGTETFPPVPETGEPIRITEERILAVIAAVDALPAPQRVPLLYVRYCGYSPEEAAVFLDVGKDTVAYRLTAGENALYEAVSAIKGCRYAGLDDIFEALREYAVTGVPEEEALFQEPEEKRTLPPILYVIAGALLILIVVFAVYLIKEKREERRIERETPHGVSVNLSAPEGAPARTAVPPATATPVPSPTATPEPFRPDVSGLATAPESWEYLDTPASAFVCVQGSMHARSGAGTKYKNLGTLESGKTVTVAAAHEGWYLVEYAEGSYAWASGNYLVAPFMFEDGTNPALAGVTPPEGKGLTILVKSVTGGDGAPLYRDPSLTGSVTDNVPFGEKVCLLTGQDEWMFVNYAGSFGWMREEAFDESTVMDVSNGSYYFRVKEGAYWEEQNGFMCAQGTLYRREYMSAANLKKYLAGETAKTKKGTKMKPEFGTFKTIGEAEGDLCGEEVLVDGGALRFVYEPGEKAYAVYEYEEPKLYAVKAVALMLPGGAAVEDDCFYPLYGTGRPGFGTVTPEGNLAFEGGRIAEYAEYLGTKDVFAAFSGRLTVKNGAVSALTLEDLG